MKRVELLIIGGGSAGMSAALRAYEKGIKDILILERSEELGGILQQCIHNGFGLQIFKEELSGPMYAQRYIEFVKEKKIAYRILSTVLEVNHEREVLYVNAEEGYVWIKAKAILFASGCFERNRGAIQIPGKRLPGVYTAGSAQRFLNMENILVGKRVFILGSGDIGLIMARRMTLEGAKVVGVAEIMPYSNGLTRNIVQCLNDYDIPLYLSHTVVDIQGKNHIENVVIARVDEHKQPIEGSEQSFAVDTLLLSIGLIPENALGSEAGIELDRATKGALVDECYQTNIPHVYACGNALHVHDIVDYVSMEAYEAAESIADDLLFAKVGKRNRKTLALENVSYVIPQYISDQPQKDITLCFRVKQPLKNAEVIIKDGKRIIKRFQKRCLLPAEMERLQIKKDEIGVVNDCLSVEVKEG